MSNGKIDACLLQGLYELVDVFRLKRRMIPLSWAAGEQLNGVAPDLHARGDALVEPT